ncbi:MAG: carboxypeptidase regulatory-like domain-containing protein [Bryobacterales bacterium]|nr:carboxypeptidase regulatory-like domain-containing protein [Bryobacterales bacterium]
MLQLLLWGILLSSPAVLFGQAVTGTIFGSVFDPTQAAIGGANVTVTNLNTGYTRQMATQADGGYRFPSLPLGSYRVAVEQAGFSSFTQEGITLQVDQQVRVDVTLRVGNVSEKMQVTAEAPLVNASNAETSEVIDRRRVEMLPLNGRNFVQLLQLTTGTTPGATGDTQNNLVINQFRGSTAFTANGMPTRYNNFVLDGVDNNESAWNSGGIVIMPVIDAIQEFKVATGNFSSEFGRAAGGVVNVQTRSGTNEFHGNVFEFFRNSALDANDYFNNANRRARPPFRQNQFGGTIGGPIKKNKLFFFADYQGTRQVRGLTYVASVPTMESRQGDFTNPAFGVIYDPATTRPNPASPGNFIRDAFPGRRIPAARFDPLVGGFLSFFPEPNTAPGAIANNFVNNPNWVRSGNQGDIRTDYNLGSKGALFLRYSRDHADQIFPNDLTTPQNPFGGGGRGNGIALVAQNLSLNSTYLLTPRVVVEGRFGLSRFAFAGTPLGYQDPNMAKAQVPGLGADAQTATSLSITGLTAFGPTTGVPNDSNQTTFQYVFNTSITAGRHAWKTGVDVKRFRRNNDFVSAQKTGSLAFVPNFTSQTGVTGGGVGMASFLLGLPSTINRGFVGGMTGRRNTELGLYVQDEFKVNTNLTLNMGVRYEYFQPWYEIHDRMSTIDLGTGRVVLAGADNPFGRALRNGDKNNFGPRFGLAWRGPKGVVVRAGYGLSYIEEFGGNGTNPIQNPPNSFTQNLVYSTIQLPPTRLRDGIPAPAPLNLSNANGLYRFIEPNAQSAYAQQWDFNVQREFGSNWLADVAYVGTRGLHILQIIDPNQPVPGPGAIANRRPYFAVAPNMTLSVGASSGASTYHSLQAKLQKRLSHGFYFLSSYTLSKNISDGDSNFSNGTPGVALLGQAQDSQNRRAERSLSDTDQLHRMVTSFGWDLPVAQRHKYLGGWQLTGIVTLSSGNPFDVFYQPATLNTGTTQRPNRIADGRLDSWTIDRYFDTAAFTAPAQFTYGNSGRNVLRGPGVNTWDFSVIKNTNFTERCRLQWRTDFFNAFNHTQFNPPGNTIGTPQAGRINSTRFSTNRQIQFVLKMFF